jgi:hypothetical protein
MSRRPPNPAAERAAQNQATIKNLLKLEPNKVCADCKRNKRRSLLGHAQNPTDSRHIRSEMGELEPRRVRLHSLLGHSPRNGHPHQPSQVRRLGRMDRRATTERPQLGQCARKQVLGGEVGGQPRPLGIQDRELYPHQVRAEEMGDGRTDSGPRDTGRRWR